MEKMDSELLADAQNRISDRMVRYKQNELERWINAQTVNEKKGGGL